MKLLRVLCVIALALFSAVTFAQMIDINTATAEQMDQGLKGIGPKKAADIVKYREANGAFKSVDDLAKVPGIKGKTLEKIKPMVTVGGTPAAPAMPAASAPTAAPPMSVKPAAVPAVPTVTPPMSVKPAAVPTVTPPMSVKPAAVPAVPAVPATPAPPVVPPKQ